MERVTDKEKHVKVMTKHDDWLFEQLKDAEFAAEYLNAAGEDDDPKTYLTALRQVVDARGGIASTAEKAHLSRETGANTWNRSSQQISTYPINSAE